MKRLLKKAEFYDAAQFYYLNGQTIEIFKNPTTSEINEILKYQKEQTGNGYMIRFFILQGGDIYAWDGRAFHADMKANIAGANDPIHFTYNKTNNSCYMHSVGSRNLEQFLSDMIAAKQHFDSIGIDQGCDITEISCKFFDVSKFKKLGDIYNFQVETPKEKKKFFWK